MWDVLNCGDVSGLESTKRILTHSDSRDMDC